MRRTKLKPVSKQVKFSQNTLKDIHTAILIQNLNCTVDNFEDFVNWDKVSQQSCLSKAFIKRFAKRLDWYIVCQTQKFTEYYYEGFYQFINWDQVSQYQELSYEILTVYHNELNWIIVSQYQKLTSKEFAQFKDKLIWRIVSRYQRISETDLILYQDYLSLVEVCQYQKLSNAIIQEYLQTLDFTIDAYGSLLCYQKLEDDTLQILIQKLINKNDYAVNVSVMEQLLVSQELSIENLELILDYYRAKRVTNKSFWMLTCMKQSLTYDFIDKYQGELDWKILLKYQDLEPDLIQKYALYLSWDLYVEQQDLTDQELQKIINNQITKDCPKLLNKIQDLTTASFLPLRLVKFMRNVPWEQLSKCGKLSTSFMIACTSKLNWKLLSRYQQLPTNLIEVHKDLVDWDAISQYQELDELFIANHADFVNWKLIFQHQKLNQHFILGYEYKIDLNIKRTESNHSIFND